MTTEPPGQYPASQYAHTTAFDAGTLAVSEIHNLHYEQYGKKDGKPGECIILSSPVQVSLARTSAFSRNHYNQLNYHT